VAVRKKPTKKAVKSASSKSARPKKTLPKKAQKAVPKRKTKGTAVFDKGRWREGGRFVAPPSAKAVRRDKQGRAIDGKGRRVPAAAVTGEIKRQAKLALAKKITFDEKPRPRKQAPKSIPIQIKAGRPVVDRELVSSYFNNTKAPDEAGEILTSFVKSSASRGPFEAEDITLFSYGVKFVGRDPLTPEQLATVNDLLPKGAELKFSDTRAGTEVYVSFPTPKGNNINQAAKKLNDRTELTQIYRELADYWGGCEWYVYAEVDEFLY
jgi:hypothetical protein